MFSQNKDVSVGNEIQPWRDRKNALMNIFIVLTWNRIDLHMHKKNLLERQRKRKRLYSVKMKIVCVTKCNHYEYNQKRNETLGKWDTGMITSWQRDGETVETVSDLYAGLQNHYRWRLQP